jgi:hypothetical protein
MIDNISLVTVLFDYPDYYTPTFFNNAKKYFPENNIHVARFKKSIESTGYYDKLYHYKVIMLLEYIQKNIFTEHILFLDATDTNFIKDPLNVLDIFKTFNCSILFCAEKEMWPSSDYTHLYEKKPVISEKKYLNSGSYIGFTEKIKYYLNNIIQNPKGGPIDDQGKWTIEYLQNNDILIDQKSEIFFSSHLAKNEITFVNQVPTLKDINACIVHDNGGHGDKTLKLVPFF